MKLSDLKGFFEKEISPQVFYERVESEIYNYSVGIKKLGASVSVLVEDDIPFFELSSSHVILLCQCFLNRIFDQWCIRYIADVISFSNNISFGNKKVEYAIDAIADPEFERLISDNYIEKIISRI